MLPRHASYTNCVTETLAPKPLSRLEILRGMRVSTWEGVWATVWMVLTTGPFKSDSRGCSARLTFTSAARRAPRRRRASSASGVALAIGSGRAGVSLGRARSPGGFSGASSRRFPSFRSCRRGAAPVFVALLALSSALLTITVPAWTSWMSDLVPAEVRGALLRQEKHPGGRRRDAGSAPGGLGARPRGERPRLRAAIGLRALVRRGLSSRARGGVATSPSTRAPRGVEARGRESVQDPRRTARRPELPQVPGILRRGRGRSVGRRPVFRRVDSRRERPEPPLPSPSSFSGRWRAARRSAPCRSGAGWPTSTAAARAHDRDVGDALRAADLALHPARKTPSGSTRL